jgi:hypothetical protein
MEVVGQSPLPGEVNIRFARLEAPFTFFAPFCAYSCLRVLCVSVVNKSPSSFL